MACAGSWYRRMCRCYRTRAERFDDLVLQAVARLEPLWEAHLSGIEFAVEEIPPADVPGHRAARAGAAVPPGSGHAPGRRGGTRRPGPRPDAPITPDAEAEDPGPDPPRIVVYRRPLMARADGEEELAELVFDVVVEEFARMLGIDPADVDPGYAAGD